MIEIEEGSGNVYADLGRADAEEMLVKAQFATKIGEIIKRRKWSQQQAVDVFGISQPKLSNMLNGQFRGISEVEMLDLAEIKPTPSAPAGQLPRRGSRW
jgi:predicted XRE-type DNA-binding protein